MEQVKTILMKWEKPAIKNELTVEKTLHSDFRLFSPDSV